MTTPTTEQTEQLQAVLRDQLFPGCTIGGLRQLSGGASQQLWAFSAATAERRVPLVLRRVARAEFALPIRTEFELVRTLHEENIPVPQPLLFVDGPDCFAPGYVMEALEGESIPRLILREDRFANIRPRLASQCGAILGRIHSVPIHRLPRLGAVGGATAQNPVEGPLLFLERLAESLGEPHPPFALAVRWLREHPPQQRQAALVHGDFRNGNLLVDESGVRAVLDWELAHIGDPLEDIGWLCARAWRFGNDDLPVGGFGTRADLLASYEAAVQPKVDHASVHYWEVFATLRWGIICTMQAARARARSTPSLEGLALGRRVCESEWDLLNLLEYGKA